MKKLFLMLVASFGVASCAETLPQDVIYTLSLMQNFDKRKADSAIHLLNTVISMKEQVVQSGNLCFTDENGKKYVVRGRLVLGVEKTEQKVFKSMRKLEGFNVNQFNEINNLLNQQKIISVNYASSSVLNLCTLGVTAAAAAGVYCYLNPEKVESAKTAVMNWTDKTARPAAQGMWNSFTNWASNTWTDLVNKLK